MVQHKLSDLLVMDAEAKLCQVKHSLLRNREGRLSAVFWHMSDSQRQKKLWFLLMLHMAFKELSKAVSQSLCGRKNGEFMHREDRQLGSDEAEDFGPGLLHGHRQSHLPLSALSLGRILAAFSRL